MSLQGLASWQDPQSHSALVNVPQCDLQYDMLWRLGNASRPATRRPRTPPFCSGLCMQEKTHWVNCSQGCDKSYFVNQSMGGWGTSWWVPSDSCWGCPAWNTSRLHLKPQFGNEQRLCGVCTASLPSKDWRLARSPLSPWGAPVSMAHCHGGFRSTVATEPRCRGTVGRTLYIHGTWSRLEVWL